MKHRRGGLRLKITITEHDQSGMDRAMNSYPTMWEKTRIQALQMAALGKYSYAGLIIKLGVSKSVLQKWFDRYRQHGLDSLLTEPRRWPRLELRKNDALWWLAAGVFAGKCPDDRAAHSWLARRRCRVSVTTAGKWRRRWVKEMRASESLRMRVFEFLCEAGYIHSGSQPSHPEVGRVLLIIENFLRQIQ